MNESETESPRCIGSWDGSKEQSCTMCLTSAPVIWLLKYVSRPNPTQCRHTGRCPYSVALSPQLSVCRKFYCFALSVVLIGEMTAGRNYIHNDSWVETIDALLKRFKGTDFFFFYGIKQVWKWYTPWRSAKSLPRRSVLKISGRSVFKNIRAVCIVKYPGVLY